LVEKKLESNNLFSINKTGIWNEVGLGSMETHLKNFIGDYFSYEKGTTIYAELSICSLNATILGETKN
jgi:hypothetical protein